MLYQLKLNYSTKIIVKMIYMSSMLTGSDYVDKLGLFAVFTEIKHFLTIIHGWLNITSWTFILC